ncbi:transcriptional regulator, LuxR family [Pseudomonas synxantha BG33R]|uniref:response regulator transcription factor n=2 Tax=Pseudomonas TaxID=286 RepID=UPI00025FF76F|nr:response regulator transcription factor [Pseudomonas synxantha]EIK71380.1 transcriptional regulator, LuxR family [Pseudomonas synxantha BG33R]
MRLIQMVRAHYPNLRIVIFSSSERPATVSMSIRAGANGFVGKSQETGELLRAIRMLALERIYLAPAMAAELDKLPTPQAVDIDQSFDGDKVLADHPELSPKESEVLRCCLEGMSVSQIATKCLRSCKTISGQKQAAFRKLGVRTDTEFFKLQIHLKEVLFFRWLRQIIALGDNKEFHSGRCIWFLK